MYPYQSTNTIIARKPNEAYYKSLNQNAA